MSEKITLHGHPVSRGVGEGEALLRLHGLLERFLSAFAALLFRRHLSHRSASIFGDRGPRSARGC